MALRLNWAQANKSFVTRDTGLNYRFSAEFSYFEEQCAWSFECFLANRLLPYLCELCGLSASCFPYQNDQESTVLPSFFFAMVGQQQFILKNHNSVTAWRRKMVQTPKCSERQAPTTSDGLLDLRPSFSIIPWKTGARYAHRPAFRHNYHWLPREFGGLN